MDLKHIFLAIQFQIVKQQMGFINLSINMRQKVVEAWMEMVLTRILVLQHLII